MPEVDFSLLARRLRERAEEALSIAESFRDPEARRMMLEIGERYHKLAERLEQESGDVKHLAEPAQHFLVPNPPAGTFDPKLAWELGLLASPAFPCCGAIA